MEAIELKLELRDPALARAILRTVGAAHVHTIDQADTHYLVPTGRLMRRVEDGGPPEFIRYERADAAHPRAARCAAFTHAQASERFGAAPLPERAAVRKSREVYLRGRVSVHLDRVDRLGWFIELVAPITREQDEAACHVALQDLRETLAPALGEPLSPGYADLIAAL
ncbi:MAG: CYTH domain-containing protein [Phycisphaerales bacterium]|nr:CYTH domain-containing protein [Phycisphaerales bacterium]